MPYISVLEVTVSGQEHFGNFIHATEKKRQLGLVWREGWNQTYSKYTTLLKTWATAQPWVMCVKNDRKYVYSHLSQHTSLGFQPFSLLVTPKKWDKSNTCPVHCCGTCKVSSSKNNCFCCLLFSFLALKWTQSTASRTSWNMLLKDMKRSPSLNPVSQLWGSIQTKWSIIIKWLRTWKTEVTIKHQAWK